MWHRRYNAYDIMGKKTKKDVGAILHHDHVSFRVWAPFAANVSVMVMFNDWVKTPMQREDDGYWTVEVKGAKAGQEYRYIIDTGHGEISRNDPRALRVTTSAGNSVIVDTTFDWEGDDFTPLPINQQVIYELYVGTFNRPDPSETGTFASAAEKLDYLADLGVTMIELMPIGSMDPQYGWWGYVVDYIYAVESQYGGRHEFLTFVKAAHQRGIGVMLDVVYNHLDANPEYGLWRFDGWSQDDWGGIYFYNDWRGYTPWGSSRLDYGRPEVRDFVLDNVRMWLQECHLDGLRLDSTGYIRNVNGDDHDASKDIPDGWSLLQDITTLAKKIKPTALVVAEDVCGNDYLTKPHDVGGAGFSAQWELSIPYFLHKNLGALNDADRNITEIADALARCYNGDAFQRVIYSDSHDSAANGHARLNEEIAPGNASGHYARSRSLLAAAIVATAPGIPMLLEGEEFMQGGSFNNWQALDWTKAQKLDGILQAHKHLLALRKNQYGNSRGLTGQSFKVLHVNEDAKVLAYHRWDQGGAGDDVVVIFNFANRTQTDYRLDFPRPGHWTIRFNSGWKGYSPDFKEVATPEPDAADGGASVTLAPYSVLILSQDD